MARRERDAFDMFDEPDRGRFGDNETREQPERTPRVTGASDLVDLDMILHNDNPNKKAIAVSYRAGTPFDQWKWLPRSLIEYENKGADIKGVRHVKVTMPEHVALEKGLI